MSAVLSPVNNTNSVYSSYAAQERTPSFIPKATTVSAKDSQSSQVTARALAQKMFTSKNIWHKTLQHEAALKEIEKYVSEQIENTPIFKALSDITKTIEDMATKLADDIKSNAKNNVKLEDSIALIKRCALFQAQIPVNMQDWRNSIRKDEMRLNNEALTKVEEVAEKGSVPHAQKIDDRFRLRYFVDNNTWIKYRNALIASVKKVEVEFNKNLALPKQVQESVYLWALNTAQRIKVQSQALIDAQKAKIEAQEKAQAQHKNPEVEQKEKVS